MGDFSSRAGLGANGNALLAALRIKCSESGSVWL
jgi:hypothetical protein